MKGESRWAIYPGTMGALSVAIDLLGIDRVSSGSWPGPFYVYGVNKEEVDTLIKLLDERVPGHWARSLEESWA